MPANFIEVDSLEELDSIFADSQHRPILIFKHSNSCSISDAVFNEITDLEGDVYLVIVQKARAVSDSIATRTAVKHQSPQSIVLRNSKAVFHASHFDITAKELSALLRNN